MLTPGAFKTLDKDNDGTIKVNVQEVRKCWHSLKISIKFTEDKMFCNMEL